ncbi:bifunctional methionine sulfoxide reductase B/A protein [Dysgonomonas mossii]|uniref:Peptide methionine sulfoxide reductase MsrA n=1 Tax=Dysgonomonas mossii TaxID=163665 RepID=A0A4Y9IQ90_9BACT|nr:bifunctional methionine sulfoxide reductase B/A protein [Dysgonomonas mossii]MBF0759749.1 bifunctional methionine sulfoxide reductase B/A protein [Dysgonomonas mossii]TFU90710.1 bifunctional methionine sulfoxide reductase B/A protein [Dysgonomonas mossii]
MKLRLFIYLLCTVIVGGVSCVQSQNKIEQGNMKYNKLTPEEERVIIHKGTEAPYTGEYVNNKQAGVYVCRRCNAPLYNSFDKFDSHCGWPSFDDEIKGAVKRVPDADGRRTEIICTNCGAHLGHVFLNEGFTAKETRHCVNSISLKFIPQENKMIKKAYFASGCFWGTEYYFMKAKGVAHTAVGFMGGHVDHPSYEQVCQKNTGHLETTEVDYDTSKTSYEDLVKLFFETHDFTQTNGQGPDIGPQYLSCIFYADENEKNIAEKYISILQKKGYKVATMLKPLSTFWKAEDYHQQYYEHKGTTPYCHVYKKIFE